MSNKMSDIKNNSDNRPPQEEQDEIIHAIRRIMKAEEAILEDDPDVHFASQEAQQRIQAALDRLIGNSTDAPQPTVLEVLVFERLDPLLRDWIDQNLPPLVERLVREQISRRMQHSGDT